MSTVVRTLFGVVIFFLGLFFHQVPPVYAAITYDMATTSNWNTQIQLSTPSSIIFGAIEIKDVNNNGKNDLLFVNTQDASAFTTGGAVYVIFDSLLESYTGTGNTIDLSDSTKWSIRFDAPVASALMGSGALRVIDFDGNGQNDLLIGCQQCEPTRDRQGTLYIIYDSILSGYTGTGNVVSLADSSNWNVRIDGGGTSSSLDVLTDQGLGIADLDNNGILDLAITARGADNNSRTNSGSFYIIYDSLFGGFTGTGNTLDLVNTSDFHVRYDGAAASDRLGFHFFRIADLDNDGKNDLLIPASDTDFNSRSDSGSWYVVFNTLLDDYTGTGNIKDMATATNWNMRFDGAAGGSGATIGKPFYITDFDADGKNDLLFTSHRADNNSRTDSGSAYLVYNNLFASITGTGTTIDLADTSKYNVRFDGEEAGDTFGGRFGATTGQPFTDLNNDGLIDLFIGTYLGSKNSRTNSGSVYWIDHNAFGSLTGTGNAVDLATTSNYVARYDGAVASALTGNLPTIGDLNNDGSNDFVTLLSSTFFYIVYNFPHTITSSLTSQSGSDVTVSGSISAPNSVTSISGVQYKIDSNSPSSSWNSCTATDGTFDSTSETYTCTTASAPTTTGTHTVYVRAYDANISYTAQANYLTYAYTIGSPGPATSGGSTASPAITTDGGGVASSGSTSVTVESGAFQFSANLASTTIFSYNPPLGIIPPLAGIGDIHQIWFTDYYNGARILTSVQLKPSIVSLRYNQFQLLKSGGGSIPERSLRLAHSTNGKTWRILTNSVVDPVNNTVSAITKVGGYYMIVVGGGRTLVQTKVLPSPIAKVSPVPKSTGKTPVAHTNTAAPHPTPPSLFQKVKNVFFSIF